MPWPILLALSLSAFAQESHCETVELDAKGGSMEHVPARVQNFGDCYSMVAAGAIDAYRFSHGDHRYGTSSSAVAIGVEWKAKEHQLKADYDGGISCEVIDSVRKAGACEFNPEFGDYLRKQGDEFICKEYSPPTDMKPPSLSQSLEIADFLEIIKPACRHRIFVKNLPHCQSVKLHHGIKDKISALLLRKNAQPVILGYCARILDLTGSLSYRGVDPTSGDLRGGCNRHASLVIGQRWNNKTNRCEFKIRNSWPSESRQKTGTPALQL